ncbi:MAG: hypothetical protein WDM71_07780 [Ferruginibacter sp.]
MEKNPATGLVEIVELTGHPFFIGVQYHPELKSTVESPQPIFVSFVRAAKEFAESKIAVKNSQQLQSENDINIRGIVCTSVFILPYYYFDRSSLNLAGPKYDLLFSYLCGS